MWIWYQSKPIDFNYDLIWFDLIWFDLLCFTPLSAIFQLYHGDQFWWWKKPEYPERTTDHGQATGKLYYLRLGVECTLFCNLQSRARTHAVLVIGLYELLRNPTDLTHWATRALDFNYVIHVVQIIFYMVYIIVLVDNNCYWVLQSKS